MSTPTLTQREKRLLELLAMAYEADRPVHAGRQTRMGSNLIAHEGDASNLANQGLASFSPEHRYVFITKLGRMVARQF